jgi:hypothetical protein
MARRMGWIVLAILAACGREEEPSVEVAPDTAAFLRDTHTYIDSATGVELISPNAAPAEGEFQAVELPEGFPSDFPVPSGGIVVEATSQPLPSGGSYSGITVVEKREAGNVFDWYHGALRESGWRIISAERAQPYRIEATKENAKINMVLQPHPEYPASGWTRVVAFVQT